MSTNIDGVSEIPVSGLGIKLTNPVVGMFWNWVYSPECVEGEFCKLRHI